MNHSKIFLWNDKKDVTRKWQRKIEKLVNSQDENKVCTSSASSVGEVVKAFVASGADIVVLDVMADGQATMGLDIARLIRVTDKLVPILIVTQDPGNVYLNCHDFEAMQFAGIFHASVLETSEVVFENIALRPALNEWNLLFPEWCLVRHCIRLVRRVFGSSEAAFVSDFTEVLALLPFARSPEAWHKQLCEGLIGLLKRRNLSCLSEKLTELSDVFQKADPFYMAGSGSRRHLSHNVQVFLIGLVILLDCDCLRVIAVEEVRKIRGAGDEYDATAVSVLLWGCIATTHDTGYLSQQLLEVLEAFQNVLVRLGVERPFQRRGQEPAIEESTNDAGTGSGTMPKSAGDDDSATPGNANTCVAMSKVGGRGEYHGYTAGRLWRSVSNCAGTPGEYEMIEIIALAIERHDSKYAKTPAFMRSWASFLAVIADEIQDWGRERPELPAGTQPYKSLLWRCVCIEGLQMIKSEGVDGGAETYHLVLNFFARAHAGVVGGNRGQVGKDTMQAGVERVLHCIRDNVRTEVPVTIEIFVDFATQSGLSPVNDWVELQLS